MKEKIQKWVGALLGGSVIALIFFGAFAVVALIGGNVMELFGFRYDSVGQLLLYFLMGELLGLPLDLLSTALPRALYQLGKVNRRQGNLLYIPMDALFTMGVFWFVDQWMDSVCATGLSLCIIGIGLALITLPIKKEP